MQAANKTLNSVDFDSIAALAADDRRAVDRLITESLESDVALVSQVSQYIVMSGGKRLRPLIVLLASRDYLFGFHEWRQRHPGDSFEFETPLKGLGIGQQMAWLRQKVRDESSQLFLFPDGRDA